MYVVTEMEAELGPTRPLRGILQRSLPISFGWLSRNGKPVDQGNNANAKAAYV